MKGIIWRNSINSENAERLFYQLITNYEFIGITGKIIKSKLRMSFYAGNGDTWEVVSAVESSRGRKCNISYIERGIPDEIVQHIIIPCTVALPFRAITYFGDYGLEEETNGK